MGMGFVKHGTLSKKKNIFWEMQLFANLRDWNEGITFFKFNINWDRYKSEHTPSFQLEFTILNYYSHFWIYQNNFEDEINTNEDDLFN